MRAGGNGHSAKKESLRAIIKRINEVWGSDVSPVTGARTINALADYVAADEVSRIQIRNSTNSKEAIIADGRLETIIKLAAVALKNNDFEALAEKLAQNTIKNAFTDFIKEKGLECRSDRHILNGRQEQENRYA